MFFEQAITKNKQAFVPYSIFGTMLFSVELFFLWLLIDQLGIPYLYATGPVFFVAVSTHFYLSKRFAFKSASKNTSYAYGKFLLVAICGALAVTVAIYSLTTHVQIDPLFARAVLALVTGIGTFFIHKHITFKPARVS